MGSSAEAENFLGDVSVSAALLTRRCLKFELFSDFCLKNREAGDKGGERERERDRGIESLAAKGFHKKRIMLKVRKCQLCIDKENKKNMKFALKKKCHILQSSNIYWADQSKSSKST